MKEMREQLRKIMDQREFTAAYRDTMTRAVADPEVQAFLQANQQALAQDAVVRGAAKIYEFVTQRDLENTRTNFAPGYMPRLVVSNRLIDITYEPTPAKRQEEALAKTRALVTAINMPKAIAGATLEGYDPLGRDLALTAALDFTIAMGKTPQAFHKGLYLTGAFGVGKTYLMGAVANELAQQNIASTLVHVPSLAVEMKAAINDRTVLPKIDALKAVPVLMLDDIGAEALSPWFRDEVLGILLQYRMQEELATWFTSNKTMKELTSYLSGAERGDQELLRAQRIMERVRFLADEVQVGGVDRRNGPTT